MQPFLLSMSGYASGTIASIAGSDAELPSPLHLDTTPPDLPRVWLKSLPCHFFDA